MSSIENPSKIVLIRKKKIMDVSIPSENTQFPIGVLSKIKLIEPTCRFPIMKKWIKEINFEKSVKYDEYNRKEYFEPIMDIVLDEDVKNGKKLRNTLIKFIPTISSEKLNCKTEWLYLFVIDGRIVKIGGTRTGIKGRVASYLCGHHVEERGKSGDCSKTNGFIYNTFEFYLKMGCKIEMYGYELPKKTFEIDIFGEKIEIVSQTFHAYESKFLEDFKKKYDMYPILSDNCDPNYRK